MAKSCPLLINGLPKIKEQENIVIHSMTGFASGQGKIAGFSWQIDVRSVNNRGLDFRLRTPEWIEGLDNAARAHLQKLVSRGSIHANIRVVNDKKTSMGTTLDIASIVQSLEKIQMIETQAEELGVDLSPSKASDVLGLTLDNAEFVTNNEEIIFLKDELLKAFEGVVENFLSSRQTEGNELAKILTAQAKQIEMQITSATKLLPEREKRLKANFLEQLSTVLENVTEADPQRVAQELALLTIKADVTEELDRLKVHVKSFKQFLLQGAVIGRKMDFLMQELNREANTLCSKSQNSSLTAIGLELKVMIDQMREQVQNVE